MTIGYDGNVGIGTTSPAAKLHVVGSSILSNNATINPDSYTGIVAGNIADGSGWGVLGIGGNNGNTGRSFGMGVSGTTFYMGFQNGSTTSSLQTFLAVSGSRNLFLVPDGGNVGIGTTSPLQKLHVLGNISTISQASSGEETNRLQFYNIGAATYDIASIRAFVGAGQANRGELGFYVNNGASQQLAMYIDRSQNVGIGTASPANTVKLDVVGDIRTSTGILFGTDTAAANLLDDYEEGTWTPVYSPTAGAFTTMPSVGSGKYRKIGDTVFFWIDLRTVGTVALGTASGDIQITGFPFTCSAAGGYGASSIFQQFNLAAAFTNLGIVITASTTIARITKNSSNTSVAYVQANELSTATGNFENLIGVIGMYNV